MVNVLRMAAQVARPDLNHVFWRHFYALVTKRFLLFQRDLKGFFFLVFIPIMVVLVVVIIVSVSLFSGRCELPPLITCRSF